MNSVIDPRLALHDVREVLAITRQGKTALYERIKQGRFPAGIRIGAKAVRWRAGDISDWLADPTGWKAPVAAA